MLTKPFHTFPIYSRFVGAVLILFQRWKHAPRVREHTPPVKWIPPAHWSQQNGHGPSAYECYLHDHWGDRLHRMIHVDKDLMKFFKPQEEDVSSNASSSTGQNKMGTTSTIKRRRNQRRRHRRRNKNGGIIRPSDTENEAVLVNERKETDSQCAKEDRCNVDGNRSSIQTRSQSANMCEKQKCKKETVSSKTSGDKTEGNNTFRYDKLFKFGSGKRKEDNDHMSGTSSAAEEASDNVNTTRKDATFRYDRLFSFRKRRYSGGNSESNVPSASTARNEHKENMPLPADKEFATDRHTANKTAKDCFFKYDRLFTFSSKKHAEVGANSNVDRTNMKAEQKEKEPTSCHAKTADSFRYDRLFNFSKKSSKVQNGSPEENDDLSASSKIGDAKKKETVHQCTDQEFNTNRDKTNKAEKKNSSFSTRKQNFADNTDDEVYMTHNSMDDSYEYDYEIRSEGSDNENIDINEFYRAYFGGPFQCQYGNRNKRALHPLRKFLMQKCNSCNILEKYPGMYYKKCRVCVQYGVQVPNVYCGEHCRRTHWQKQHRADHFPKKHTQSRLF